MIWKTVIMRENKRESDKISINWIVIKCKYNVNYLVEEQKKNE